MKLVVYAVRIKELFYITKALLISSPSPPVSSPALLLSSPSPPVPFPALFLSSHAIHSYFISVCLIFYPTMTVVTIKPTVDSPNVIEIVIQKESHTCAAPIVERLNKDPACQYAAYKIEHPSDSFVSIRVQGNEHKNAKTIFTEGVYSIIEDLDSLLSQLRGPED